MGSMGAVKTTLDINDELLLACQTPREGDRAPLRAVVEDGLRRYFPNRSRSHTFFPIYAKETQTCQTHLERYSCLNYAS